MNRVFVVGGAGFIGSHLVEVCLDHGCEVSVYDNFSTGHQALVGEHRGFGVVVGDVLDTAELAAALREFRPDVVFHLAAVHHVPTCEEMPEHALRTNVEGTQSVLTACAEAKVPRLVFASTGAVYDTSDGPLAETSATRATTLYAITKLAGEELIHHHFGEGGRQAVIARLFNAVGARETNPHLVPEIIAQVAAGQRELKVGNVHPRRDYVHVRDSAAALFELGRHDLANPVETFNVGSGREHSIPELVEILSSVLGEPLSIVSVPKLKRKADRASQLADIGRIRAATGWRPRHSLREALSEAWSEQLERADVART